MAATEEPSVEPLTQRPQRLPLPILVAAPASAFLIVGAWVLWDANATEKSKAFIATPQFLLWWLILCGQAAVWTLCGGLLWATVSRRMRALRRAGALPTPTLAGLGAALAIVVVLATGPSFYLRGTFYGIESIPQGPIPRHFPLVHYATKLSVMVGIGLLLTLLAMVGMLATALAFQGLRPQQPPDQHDLRCFLVLRDELARLLAIAGLLVALAALTTITLRLAVLAVAHDVAFRQDEIPLQYAPGYIVAYGLLFSGVLALAFAPSFMAMRAAGARLRDNAHPLPAPADPQFGDVVLRRRALDELLQTTLSASSTFKVAAAILTPLVGGLASLVLS